MRILKLIGAIVGVLVVAAGIGAFVIDNKVEAARTATYEVAPDPIAYATDPTTVARGEYLFVARGCADCHGEDATGKVVIPGGPLYGGGSNLTGGAGSAVADYTAADWERAIRHAVRPDGTPIVFMPSTDYEYMSDAEVGALIAYLENLAPADAPSPGIEVRPLGKVLYVAGKLPLFHAELIDHAAAKPAAPPVSDTVEYGAYIAKFCTGCHRANLAGGPIPGAPPEWPPAENLTPYKEDGAASWTTAEFIHAMKTGERPDGSEIDPVMPFSSVGQMHTVELKALHKYLKTLEPHPPAKG